MPVLDKEKNIAFLLKELDSLRDLNKKVNSHIKKFIKSVTLCLNSASPRLNFLLELIWKLFCNLLVHVETRLAVLL